MLFSFYPPEAFDAIAILHNSRRLEVSIQSLNGV